MKRLVHCIIVIFLTGFSIPVSGQVDTVATKIEPGAPVIYKKDTLFRVYSKLGSFNPAERAEIIERRINTLAFESDFEPDSLKIATEEQVINIVYDDIIIVTITEGDASAVGLTKELAAKKIHDQLRYSLEGALTFNRIKTILLRIGLTILEILILYFLIKYVNKLFVFTRKWLIKSKDKFFKGFKLRNYEFLDASRQLSLALFVNNILRWVFIIFIL